jgi:ABC-type nitrate/sulfonate/bicarbonate transport system substrate-binding protein
MTVRKVHKLVGLLICLSMSAATNAGDKLDRVNFGLSSTSLPSAAPRIAKEMGLFEKHGIDANLVQMQDASVNTMGLIAGSVDFITAQPTDVIISRSRGQNLVSVTSVYRGFAGVVVLSKPEQAKLGTPTTAPPTSRLKALDGLVIATSSATSTYTLALKAATESVGAHVRFVFIAQTSMASALAKGAIQGFIASSPFYAQAVLADTGVIWLNGPKGDFPGASVPANTITLNTKADYAKSHPEITRRVADVFSDFGTAVVANPAAVKAAVAKVYPDLDKKTLNILYETEAQGWKVKPLSVEDMAHDIAFVKATGISLPDLDKIRPDQIVLGKQH